MSGESDEFRIYWLLTLARLALHMLQAHHNIVKTVRTIILEKNLVHVYWYLSPYLAPPLVVWISICSRMDLLCSVTREYILQCAEVK